MFYLIVRMLVDIRNRKSSSPVKIPPKYQAYLYSWCDIGVPMYKVVIADSQIHADQYIHDWCFREGIDTVISFRFLGCIDYEIAGVAGDDYYKQLLF